MKVTSMQRMLACYHFHATKSAACWKIDQTEQRRSHFRSQ